MKGIRLSELLNLHDYEKVREELRARVIAVKRNRRLRLGDSISFLFENRDTVLFQIQEMLRTERIVKDDKIQDELDIYNPLLPTKDELSATMFLEIEDQVSIRAELQKLIGVDESISIEMGEDRIPGIAEAGRKTEEKMSAVQYIRFRFSSEQKKKFLEGRAETAIVCNHPNYLHRAPIPENVLSSLSADLLSED
jgi:hypothetical protein